MIENAAEPGGVRPNADENIHIILSSTCADYDVTLTEFMFLLVRVGGGVEYRNKFVNSIVIFVCRSYMPVSSVAGELGLLISVRNGVMFGKIWLGDIYGRCISLNTDIFQAVIPKVSDMSIRDAFGEYGNQLIPVSLVSLPLSFWSPGPSDNKVRERQIFSKRLNTLPGNYDVRYYVKMIKITNSEYVSGKNGFKQYNYCITNTTLGMDVLFPSFNYMCFVSKAPKEFSFFVELVAIYISRLFDCSFFIKEEKEKSLDLPFSATAVEITFHGRKSLIYERISSNIIVVSM